MTGMGMHPPVPDEVQSLTDALRAMTAERDQLRAALGQAIRARANLWVAAYRVDEYHRNGVGGDLWWAALDQLAQSLLLQQVVSPLSVVEPDDDELNASIARHPAGKGRRP